MYITEPTLVFILLSEQNQVIPNAVSLLKQYRNIRLTLVFTFLISNSGEEYFSGNNV